MAFAEGRSYVGADVAVSRRVPLSRERVLEAAVAFADGAGIEALSMRKLADILGVVPMALYKHVANKDELVGGMVDLVVGEIDRADGGSDWRLAIRLRVLSARRALQRHPWAVQVIESRTTPSPPVLEYMDSIIGMFRSGGFSIDLTHHVMHAFGSRIWGFTQEVFNGTERTDPAMRVAMLRELAETYPNIAEVASPPGHAVQSIGRAGCDEQFEFEFALDLLLDGFERLREQGWTSATKRGKPSLR